MNPVEAYLSELHRIRGTGSATQEVSFYGPLRALLNAVGEELSPRVHCVMQIRDQGAGLPDGGLFTEDQLRGEKASALESGAIPARGVIEVKGTGDSVDQVARSEQVGRYLERYGQVLVTNLRDFLLIEQRGGACRMLDRIQLAQSEAEFWGTSPRTIARREGVRLLDFLKRVLLHRASLAQPRDVAWFLASYAREARHRLEGADLEALGAFREALEKVLDIRFEGEDGDHFFRSTLVQTLFYGVFSAWVHWARDNPGPGSLFDWRLAPYHEHVPVLRQLFHVVADPGQLKRLRLDEVLDWAADALNRVDRTEFFGRFDQELAVQYFYEPFLEAFDAELRKRLGVWYTPPEVVRYMVERVDTVLRTELGVADGLADRRVRVLDPACGTGAYLVGVLDRIARTLREKGDDALLAADLKRAAVERVFGFEILPASFVIAHLQVGLFLRQHGAALTAGSNERAAIYLTNSLTDWAGPPEQINIPFSELRREREAAERVKREEEILVILGNPPYDGYAGMAMGEERELVEAYRKTRRVPAPQGQGLNDLYVRFFRVAERRIVEMTGKGIVCFISNYSWLDGLSHTGMRERFLDVFDKIWIDNLNGDKYRTGKLTPDGQPDPSIFSTEWNREGIQVGTAIALLVRREAHQPTESVLYRELWGRDKRTKLLETADQRDDTLYREIRPAAELGLPFMPAAMRAEYLEWPRLPEIFPRSFPGVKTSRDDALVEIDRERLVERMEKYFDPKVEDDTIREIAPSLMESTRRFDARRTRAQLAARGFLCENVVRYCYRPFDVRWLYWEPETKLLDERRPDYVPHVTPVNIWLSSGQRNRKGEFYQPQVFRVLADHHVVESNASMFPLYLAATEGAGNHELFTDPAHEPVRLAPNGLQYNLTDRAAAYLERIGSIHDAPSLFYHVIAVLHAPAYRLENAGALRQDWPRIPLPATREVLLASAALGRELATLLDPEQEVAQVTAGEIRTELRSIGNISKRDGGPVSPEAGDLDLTAGWGYRTPRGIVMPGIGRASERRYSPDEVAVLEEAAARLAVSSEELLEQLGRTTYDIWLNDVVYWKNIPARVWEYTLGGYPVLKKWLSYREREVLGRGLTVDEARYFRDVARRIAAILLLGPHLDANYLSVAASAETLRRTEPELEVPAGPADVDEV